MKRIEMKAVVEQLGGSQKTQELLRLEPFGVTVGIDDQRPLMLFRVQGTERVMPVWLSPIEAGIAVSQHHHRGSAQSPHDLALRVLDDVGLEVDRCVFEEVRGHHQYVRVFFKPQRASRKPREVSCRAEQAISFCLQGGAQFFTRPECVQQSQEMNVEMLTSDLHKPRDRGDKNRQKYLN